jgi:hypothetical protein
VKYNREVSVKVRISLPDDLALALKEAACRKKMPIAQFIRETMESWLWRERSTSGGDPFASITNLVDAPNTGLAEKVDEILYRTWG